MTPSGTTPSLNEIESMVWKAARGAGLPWGLAEEMGQAARWLADRGFAWAEPVVRCLGAVEAAAGRPAAPQVRHGIWSPAGTQPLNPALCGPLLSDLASAGDLRFERVAWPVLLLPYAARAAVTLGATFCLQWRGAAFICKGPDFLTAAEPSLPDLVAAVTLTHKPSIESGPLVPRPAGAPRQPVAENLLAKLEHWVRRTYVPASLESRLAGAGAGLTDND